MDNGWTISFRIHNASSRIEPSLKFDIQLIGFPSAITNIEHYWED
ncbi:HaeIII family restriction endonuclease [uncultured Streptococcus sp.]